MWTPVGAAAALAGWLDAERALDIYLIFARVRRMGLEL
jgi:hypothetical protein